MKKLTSLLLALLFTITAVVETTNAMPRRMTVKVESVYDGDTFTVIIDGEEEKIRIIGIDTPEIKKGKKNSCLGKEVRDYVKEMIEGKEVIIKKDKYNKNRDSFGRLLRSVRIINKEKNRTNDLGRKLLKKGYAEVYDKADFKYEKIYKLLESHSKKSKRGIWSEKCTTNESEEEKEETSKVEDSEQTALTQNSEKEESSDTEYSCDVEKRYCTKMTSCEEAKFYLNTCGLERLDADGDGLPCESLCRDL